VTTELSLSPTASRATVRSPSRAEVSGSADEFRPLGESNRVEVQLQSDGEIQAHLSALITGAQWRRRGLGRALVRDALARAGGLRIDVLSRSGSNYRSLGAESVPGFRLHKETVA
jgi:GNAT superfamily N-acetyltransferase